MKVCNNDSAEDGEFECCNQADAKPTEMEVEEDFKTNHSTKNLMLLPSKTREGELNNNDKVNLSEPLNIFGFFRCNCEPTDRTSRYRIIF